jgi:glycosyltransferase 2 family protein
MSEPETADSRYPRHPARNRLLGRSRGLTYGSWVVSAGALAYVLSRLHYTELRKEVTGITWWLVVAAIVLEILPRLLEAVRWQYLLRPLRTGFVSLLQAIYVGTLYSGVLPFSGGDVVRAAIVARRGNVSLTRVLSTELIERVADAFAIILMVWFTLRGLAIPYALRIALALLEVGVGIAIGGGLVLAAQNANVRGFIVGWKPKHRLWSALKSILLDVVDAAGRIRLTTMLVAVSAALGATFVNIASYWLILRAYHINLSILQSAALFAIVMIGTFLPGTPGNVGTWQFFCAVGLQLFGISAARAAGYSLVAFVIWTIPPVIMGMLALFVSPLKWAELRGQRSREGSEERPRDLPPSESSTERS